MRDVLSDLDALREMMLAGPISNSGKSRIWNVMGLAEVEIRELRVLVKAGEAVVNDFMPNIGRCAIQDYGAVNEFLMKAAKVAMEDQ